MHHHSAIHRGKHSRIASTSDMKILVVKLSSLGDILHMFPAISDLRRRFPDAEIHWLIEPAFSEVAGWHAAVDKVITVPLRSHKKAWWKIPGVLGKLRAQLRTEAYDVVLDAQGLLKSAVLGKLAGAPVFGFDARSARESQAAWFYNQTAQVASGLHIIEKNRQLVAGMFGTDVAFAPEYGLEAFRGARLQAGLPVTLQGMVEQPYVVLLHGTTWDSKYWPEDAWLELISLLTQQGWCCLLPWGNTAEHKRAQRFRAAGGEYAHILPKLTLTELMTLLLHAQAFVSVESGIGHLAAALDVPGVMLHGPTDPEYSGILGRKCRHLTSGISCSPCFKRNCPKLQDGQRVPPCQQLITPDVVFRQCLDLFATSRRANR
jgi:heptosyltransferase-1